MILSLYLKNHELLGSDSNIAAIVFHWGLPPAHSIPASVIGLLGELYAQNPDGKFVVYSTYSVRRASCKIPSSGIGFGRAVDFAGFGRQEIAAPSIDGRGKDNARCFQARRDCAG